MIGPGLAGATFNAYAYGYDPGLEGTLEVRIEDSDGNLITGPTTDDIIEIDVGGTQSVYRWVGTYPPVGEYIVIWEDPDGVEAAEELISGVETVTLLPGPSTGPCQDWVTSDEVAECCGVEPGTDVDTATLETAATMASELLYILSARQFPGVCARKVRPCRSGCGCTHGGDGWRWTGMYWSLNGSTCGCGCVQQVRLYGGPVRAIVEVKIDGETVAPDEYRLDENRYLVRLADSDGRRQAWPRCQRLDLADTETGTWSVEYLAGLSPPTLGVQAAASLACELFRACRSSGECALPTGVTRVVRQGLTIEKVTGLASMLRKGQTGLPLVDAFMAAYNPTGSRRPAAVWSPDMPRPRRVT